MRHKLHVLFLGVALFIFLADNSRAENLGIGAHAGYGTLSHKEGDRSESLQKVLFYGISGEHSLKNNPHFFTGFVIDWGTGFYDDERWEKRGSQSQSNDIRFFGQFYEARLGYKNDYGDYYYRAFIAEGMDILRYKRDDFIFSGIPLQESGTEKINLWRTSLGAGLGKKIGKWTLDSRIAYSLHPSGRIKYSADHGTVFETQGTCVDGGIGLAIEVAANLGLYAGISYSLIKLDENNGSSALTFPGSETEILLGMLNVTYSF
ncbi:MAG: hypothetical protein HY809_10680 [Nitrospirae bacterium]|nr:hypothetical protein [Nitrospirota bacterium]